MTFRLIDHINQALEGLEYAQQLLYQLSHAKPFTVGAQDIANIEDYWEDKNIVSEGAFKDAQKIGHAMCRLEYLKNIYKLANVRTPECVPTLAEHVDADFMKTYSNDVPVIHMPVTPPVDSASLPIKLVIDKSDLKPIVLEPKHIPTPEEIEADKKAYRKAFGRDPEPDVLYPTALEPTVHDTVKAMEYYDILLPKDENGNHLRTIKEAAIKPPTSIGEVFAGPIVPAPEPEEALDYEMNALQRMLDTCNRNDYLVELDKVVRTHKGGKRKYHPAYRLTINNAGIGWNSAHLITLDKVKERLGNFIRHHRLR